MSRSQVHLGDLLRAARVLEVSSTDGLAGLASAMGLEFAPERPRDAASAGGPGAPPTGSRPAPTPRQVSGGRPVPVNRPAGDRPAVNRPVPDGRPRAAEPVRDPVGAAPQAAPAAAAGAVAATGASLLTVRPPRPPAGATEPGRQPAPEDTGGPPGPGDGRSGEIFGTPWTAQPPPPASPWNPRTERAILLAVASTDVAGRTVDHPRLLEMVMHGLAGGLTPHPRVPYRRRPTTRAGVHLLLDRGESMRPFRHDQTWIAQLAARILPPGQLRILDFRITQGASGDGGRAWEPHPVPPHGQPVLLMSDLGHLQPPLPGRHGSSPPDWVPYLRRLRHAGNPVTCLTPFPPQSYPAAIRQTVTLLPLDRRTSVRLAQAETRRDRRRRGRGT